MSIQANKAAAAGKIEKLTALRDAGEDLSALAQGRTPLIEAVIAGQAATVDWLLAQGVDLNACDEVMGWTALGWTCEGDEDDEDAGERIALKRRLIASGAHLEAQQDGWRRTPLMAAAQSGQGDLVDVLLAAGANITAQDPLGCTAADLARSNKHTGLAQRIDALLPPELRADAPAQPLACLPWPEEAWPQLRWPQDFPPLDTRLSASAVAMGEEASCFDADFHAALAPQLLTALASPTAALRTWLWSMNDWARAADQGYEADRAPAHALRPDDADDVLTPWLVGAMVIRQALATPRKRKYPHASVGFPFDPPWPMDLRSVSMDGASTCTIETLAWDAWGRSETPGARPAMATRGQQVVALRDAEVHSFVLKRKAIKASKTAEWRVDSWRSRSLGLEAEWRARIM